MIIGKGVLQGMGITLKTFLQTFPWGRVMLRAVGIKPSEGLVTIQYPDEKQVHHERFRVFPFLIYDGTPDNLRCVSCKICEQECPPQCIHINGPAKDEQGRPSKAYGRTFPVTFEIDTSICMSCRICVDVCPFDAIEMDNQYELAARDRYGSMNMTKEQLLKPNEYFQKIKPTESGEVDARLAAKAAKSAAAASPKPATPPPTGPVPPAA